MSNAKKVDFTFGWLALKLLGKSLYSNAWSAISELVANGFDAGARKVYVYINNTNKADATIELFDDGHGMDEVGMVTYAKVGFNKREGKAPTDDGYLVMGRKGIGKLAALYLSEDYYLFSKTDHSDLKWQMTYRENAEDEEEKPFLSVIDHDVDLICKKEWETCKTGTLLRLNHVNLTGLGDVAYDALARKLANFFAIGSMGERNIYLCVHSKGEIKVDFGDPITKEIAFKNMAFIEYGQNSASTVISTIDENRDNIIEFPYAKLNGNQTYKHQVEVSDYDAIESIQTSGQIECINIKGEKVKKDYVLTGWIGLHSTIDVEQAQKNDKTFARNKFYNPMQLRLYVRNKLAIENFLNVINNTQAFVNYIEGEIHFDVLDEDDLPDIATSNRQGLDEHDERVRLLVDITRKIVQQLISKRTALAEKIKNEQSRLMNKQNDNAKKRFVKEVESEVASFDGLSMAEKTALTTVVSNKIKGDVTPKSDFLVFISHSREDKCITDFIYYLLKHKGAKDSEFFYTSRDDNVDQYQNTESLANQIKNNIVRDNVLLLYLTSNAYKNSEFCMFEGGAGWATKSVGDYIALSLTYSELPKFITNGKLEFTFEKAGDIPLDRLTYLFIRRMLNHIIQHLNAGRVANGEPEIASFSEDELPTDLELDKLGKHIEEFYDSDIKEHWDFYIKKNLSEYMSRRYPSESKEDIEICIEDSQKKLITV